MLGIRHGPIIEKNIKFGVNHETRIKIGIQRWEEKSGKGDMPQLIGQGKHNKGDTEGIRDKTKSNEVKNI